MTTCLKLFELNYGMLPHCVCMCMYVYVCVCVCICVYAYVCVADVFNRGYGGYNSRWGRLLTTHLFPHSLTDAHTHSSVAVSDRDKYFLVTVW
jgi:hypothetical protein